MSDRARKLLARLRKSPANCTRADLERLYLGFGFEIRPGAKHDIIKHPEMPGFRETLPRHSDLPVSYVRQAIKNIDALEGLRGDREDKESDQ